MSAQPLRPGSPAEPVELVPIRGEEPGQNKPKISLQQVGNIWSLCLNVHVATYMTFN